jgi:hypothetical protein
VPNGLHLEGLVGDVPFGDLREPGHERGRLAVVA